MRGNVPDYAKAFVDRAVEFEKRGEHEEAEAVYREGLALHPDIAVLHNNLGCSLANQERYEEAKAAFERAIALTPDNREQGLVTPATYPAEPLQNLRQLNALVKGTLRARLSAWLQHRRWR